MTEMHVWAPLTGHCFLVISLLGGGSNSVGPIIIPLYVWLKRTEIGTVTNLWERKIY